MRLSRASGYAIQAVVAMAARKDEGPLVASRLTVEARGLPRLFLLKQLKSLANAGILHSRRGPGGGYQLARPAKAIALLDIVEAVDGPIRAQVPFSGAGAVHANRKLLAVCQQITDQTRELLGKVTVADLLRGERGRVK